MTTYATLHTNHGDIKVELFDNQAPKTVKNFVGLATGENRMDQSGHRSEDHRPLYDGVIFHRSSPSS